MPTFHKVTYSVIKQSNHFYSSRRRKYLSSMFLQCLTSCGQELTTEAREFLSFTSCVVRMLNMCPNTMASNSFGLLIRLEQKRKRKSCRFKSDYWKSKVQCTDIKLNANKRCFRFRNDFNTFNANTWSAFKVTFVNGRSVMDKIRILVDDCGQGFIRWCK